MARCVEWVHGPKIFRFGQTVNNESYLATEVFRGKKNVATKGKKLGGRFMLKSGNVGKSVFEKKTDKSNDEVF